MKLASTVSSLLHVVLFAAIALISAPRANADFKVPPLTGRVVDAGKVFTEAESVQIEAAILRLESATGGQMVVTTLPSLEGLSIEDVGIRLGDAWKIGNKGKDDGAILIIVVPERKMRLEVGLGWEGPINDARAGDVIRGLAPFFRANKYADGAVWAVESVQQYVTGKEVERTVAVPASGNSDTDQPESKSESLFYTILGVFCSLPLFGLLFYCLWAIFVYAVIMPIWLLLFLIFALCGKELPTFDPAALLGLGFLSSLGDGGSSSSSSSSSSSYSGSSHSSSSSSSHYSGGGGRFGGGGASGGW